MATPSRNKTVTEKTVVTQDALGTWCSILIRDETFRFKSALPAMISVDLAAATMPDADQSQQIRALQSIEDYLVHPEDQRKLRHLLRAAEPVIDQEELFVIFARILTAIAAGSGANFPTPQ